MSNVDFDPLAEDDGQYEPQNATLAGAVYNRQEEFSFLDDLLETDDNNESGTNEQEQEEQRQARIMSGDLAPEPAEYCTATDVVYSTYDSSPYQNVRCPSEPHTTQQYSQMPESWNYEQQDYHYASTANYEDGDHYNLYSAQASSSAVNGNPFEEEDESYNTVRSTAAPVTRTIKSIIKPMKIIVTSNATLTDYNEAAAATKNRVIDTRSRVQRRLPMRKDVTDDLILSKNVSEKVRTQTAQRVTTPEGWNRLYQWLKTAVEQNDREKIINLLEICKIADVSIELLRVTETAKLVKDLWRKHSNATINSLSNDVLNRWKAVVASATKKFKSKPAEKPEPKLPTKKVVSDPQKPPQQHAPTDVNLLDNITEAMDKDVIQRNETGSNSPDQSKKPRTKAKVKISKSRKTGTKWRDAVDATLSTVAKVIVDNCCSALHVDPNIPCRFKEHFFAFLVL